jgi:hypothetical protein
MRGRVRRGLSFANVVSLIALFVALGGGAYAAVKLKSNQVKSKHIAANAVQGVDANEASFGQVPSAAAADRAQAAATADRAQSAAEADNAAAVGGVPPEGLQFGDGFDTALAGTLANNVEGGINLVAGGVGFRCDSNPDVLYEDAGPDPANTDIWIDGAHQVVQDQDDTEAPVGSTEATVHVHVWGGEGSVANVTASIEWDGADCGVAFTAQENGDDSGARRSPTRRTAAPLPDGWTELEPSR